MKIRKSAITQLLVIFVIIMCYLYLKAAIKQDKLENDEQISNHNHQSAPQWSREIYDQWHDCIMENLTHYRGDPETVGLTNLKMRLIVIVTRKRLGLHLLSKIFDI